MTTPAMIFYKDETGIFNGTVCYCEGEVSSLDKILYDHCNSQKLAKELVENGDIIAIANSPKASAFYSQYSFDLDISRGLNKYRMMEEASYCGRAYFFENGAWHILKYDA